MAQSRHVPLRKCTGCQEMKTKKEMLRILRTAEGEILLDISGKKNGRGAYVCRSRECFEKAVKNKGLERSLKIKIPEETYESLKKEIESIEKR
ncbi:MAG TPA: YlxR family protein [Candidatus Choladousia intestinavium]|uniref:YlxR family protein n=1 Tax=Candidatus Choladousia intestinavium TaxID=2840727 RepID=A0A9D1ADB2_9FIRM|nr:YlxR family protein [Candidatus Choladousia intestinavium]